MRRWEWQAKRKLRPRGKMLSGRIAGISWTASFGFAEDRL
jgi:hypothetical protein